MIRFLLFVLFVGLIEGSAVPHATGRDLTSAISYERQNFLALLAHNPNYFGTAPLSIYGPVSPLYYDTTYEQLECIGYNPLLRVLSATIEIKLPYGFDGDLCSNGSFEYVRFWASYDAGVTWSNIGYATVNTHDLADSLDCERNPTKPLFYTLSIRFDPDHKNCEIPVLPKIRAILSWNQLPSDTNPFWPPVYGNAVEAYIQSLAQSTASTTYYRSGFEPSCSQHEGMIVEYADQDGTMEQRGLSKKQQTFNILSEENPPLEDSVFQNTRYEELTCLGLDWSLSSLIATVHIKQPFGYLSPPCVDQSYEYVSFWADWNDRCEWTFLGTARITVHDFGAQFSRSGLVYTAIMPVNLVNFSAPCNVTKVPLVRAALGFDKVPPPPPLLAPRGNYIQRHVHLQPFSGIVNSTQPHIRSIGGIPVQQIDTTDIPGVYIASGETLAGAQFIGLGGGAFADPSSALHDRGCPFGGRIEITGEPVPGFAYRLMTRPYNPADPTDPGTPWTQPVTVTDFDNPPTYQRKLVPDSEGYLNYIPNPLNNWGNMLSFWIPSGVDGYWQIRLEMATQGPPGTHVSKGYTPWYKVLVNNDGPQPTTHITITGGTSGGVCGDFTTGATVDGMYDAWSPYFDSYSFEVEPASQNSNPVTFSGSNLVPVLGASWHLNTGSTPCGYTVTLHAFARNIIDSNPFERLHWDPVVGFCVRAS